MSDLVVPTAVSSPSWYSYDQIAAELGTSVRTVQRWIRTGQVPSPFYLGSLARFTPSWLLDVKANGLRAVGTFTRGESVRAYRHPANVEKRQKELKEIQSRTSASTSPAKSRTKKGKTAATKTKNRKTAATKRKAVKK